jgi:glutathione S-transferase
MFFEQYNHEPNIATLRFWLAFVGEDRLSDQQRAQIPSKIAAGEAALRLMDEHLSDRTFFTAGRLTLADIALYAYTHVAAEGGFMLADYPHVQAWMARVAAAPGHVRMDL